ncbi:MAG: T9SS type A sorting domain-containing protein [Saprospiraceae bacterium]
MIKSTCSLFALLQFSVFLSAQPGIQWQQTFGGTEYEDSKSIQQTRDGGYIVAGTAYSEDGDVGPTHGYDEFWILKLDSLGTIQWKRAYGGSELDDAFSIQLTSDGGYIAVGFTRSNDGDVSGHHGYYDAWVLKLDSTGNIQWQKCLGGSGWEEAWDVQQTTDGGYIVVGRSGTPDGDVTTNHGSLDYWVIKLNDTGQIEWQKSLGGGLLDLAYSVVQTADGGYIVAGESNSPDGDVTNVHGSSDYWVVKLNFEGKIEWQKALGGTGLDRANQVLQTREGGYIVIGQARSSNGDVSGSHGGYDFWVVKLDVTGNIEWQRAMGGSGEDYGRAIQQTKDGGYILTGQTQSNNGDVIGNDGGADVWVLKLLETGEIQWQKTMGGSQAEHGYSILQAADEGYIVAGEAWSNNGDVSGVLGKKDYWIVKLSPESTPTTSPAFQQLEIYPNPTAESIRMKFPGGESSFTVTVTDLLGRELQQQIFNPMGKDEAELILKGMSDGFYLIRATTGKGNTWTGKAWKRQ